MKKLTKKELILAFICCGLFLFTFNSMVRAQATTAYGYCCLDGKVVKVSYEECKKRNGVFFSTYAEARVYCIQGEVTWCCVNGQVFPATPEECKEKGGVWFASKATALRYCDHPQRGWCCVNGKIFRTTPVECKRKGGVWYPTYSEAKKRCRNYNKLPDLKIDKITVNRKCQVVVVVKNDGPGMVPDNVWNVHTPLSSSVYLWINGKRWGGATIWKFDPARSLKMPGGIATYVSTLKVPGSAKIKATVDHTAQVVESNEGNNFLNQFLRCRLKLKSRLYRR